MITMKKVSEVNIFRAFRRRLSRCAIPAIVLAFSLDAHAGRVEITADFRPDPANPMVNKFTNTTPDFGYCQNWPPYCRERNIFSLNLPMGAFPQTVGGPIAANHSDPREGAFWRVPSQWRTLTVTNQKGDTEQLEIRVSGIGGRADLGEDARIITGEPDIYKAVTVLWSSGRWNFAPLPCISPGGLNGNVDHVIWMWLIPEGATQCSTTARFDIPNFFYRYVQFAYELRTPNPLGMPTGVYRGSLTYTIGPGMDFDFGNRVLPNDSIAQLDFVLNVEHTLRVEVPPGGNRVELIPQGGWQAWLNQGRKPARLFRDQTFNISASSRFKMQMACERVIGDTCALKNNTDGHEVPLGISVSLPHGLNGQDGAAVNRLPLLLSGAGTELFQPGFYVDRRPGTLHFEVTKESTDQMLSRGGSTYSGQVSVVWDSEL
ncbi:hypothetical protein [Pseudomonas azotoformans]|jgi:hypothetical protein|uniref:hypothetical protein n=1 Tax=Pseudomonas azotoformans TaxID=47878 RepID=UPI0021B3056F|nr:hypothetical protein [Pseudomonas azotoformans]